MMPTIEIARLDEMSDYYILMPVYLAGTSSRTDRIGFNRDETVKRLTHTANIDDGGAQSLLLNDDLNAYQNNTSKTAYAVVAVRAIIDAGERKFKIHSSPTSDTVAGTKVFDTDDFLFSSSLNVTGEKLTAFLLPIQPTHFIVLENFSGSTPRNIDVDNSENTFESFVIEQA